MNSSYLNLLTSAMDAYSMRNEAINSNLANVNTPNYKRKYVKFEQYLSTAQNAHKLKGALTDKRHIPIPAEFPQKASIAVDNSVSTREDGNNVNIDTEEVDSTKNYVNYSMVADAVINYFKSMNTAITGGRK